jgi:hypothetical protein
VYQLQSITLQKFLGATCWGTAVGLWDTIDQVLIREEINNLRVAANGGHDCVVVGYVWVPSDRRVEPNLPNTKIVVEVGDVNNRVWWSAQNRMNLIAQGAVCMVQR